MGYVSKDIAKITEPKVVSLSGVPNFVIFENKNASAGTPLSFSLTILPNDGTRSFLNLVDYQGGLHEFKGTVIESEVGGAVYWDDADTRVTLQNLRQAMLSDPWIAGNFNLVIPFEWEGGTPVNGYLLMLTSKGVTRDYDIPVVAFNRMIRSNNTPLRSTDTLSEGASDIEIELDFYEGANIPLGADDRPITADKIGTFVIATQKLYAGAPLWFDVNGLFSRQALYNRPPGSRGWFNTGTAITYRFNAKRKGKNVLPFYQSNALYAITGYGRSSDNEDMTRYVFAENTVTLLTNQPRIPYVYGQRAFLNFILSNGAYDDPNAENYMFDIVFEAYSQSDKFIGQYTAHSQRLFDMSIVNTCDLDMSSVLDLYPTAGIIRVALRRRGVVVSNYQEYEVVPTCLHTITSFCFLNRLGGWDCFNFDGSTEYEPRTSPETFNKTVTPYFKKGDPVETVYASELSETLTLTGAPVKDEVARWLVECMASKVILDDGNNYIVIDDFSIKVDPADKDIQIPTIKYHYSEKLTND